MIGSWGTVIQHFNWIRFYQNRRFEIQDILFVLAYFLSRGLETIFYCADINAFGAFFATTRKGLIYLL